MTHQTPHSRRRGFTLTELLLAIGLLTAGLTSVLLLFPTGARMQADAVNDTAGRAFAESALAAVRANANLLTTLPNTNTTLMPITANGPTALTPLPWGTDAANPTTAGLPIVIPPTGKYAYRVCVWQPVTWQSSSSSYVNAVGHYNAAVFVFIPSYGNGEVQTPPSITANLSTASANGLTTLSFPGLTDFAPDQQVILQINNPAQDVIVAHVVSYLGGKVVIAPALPVSATGNVTISMAYIPQKCVAIATGSIR